MIIYLFLLISVFDVKDCLRGIKSTALPKFNIFHPVSWSWLKVKTIFIN